MRVTDFVGRELAGLMLGKELGEGMSRKVYECRLLPDCVVKIEEAQGHFQNVLEWEVWNRVKHTAHAKWFAPCLHISPCGGMLIMAKTVPAPKLPTHIPAFFTDTKAVNFGIYEGRFVAHDYGFNLLMENGMTKRVRKVDWW